MCTSLVPVIGYDESAAVAKDAFKQSKTVRQLAHETLVGAAAQPGADVFPSAKCLMPGDFWYSPIRGR